MLQNASFLAIVAVHTVENERFKSADFRSQSFPPLIRISQTSEPCCPDANHNLQSRVGVTDEILLRPEPSCHCPDEWCRRREAGRGSKKSKRALGD
jgi:hypothetical protein